MKIGLSCLVNNSHSFIPITLVYV